ncbi:MAG: Asp-tRNA(Asn)/Glu-tRNA(Gln) amidotransferase subunit GatB [Ignavibacteriales bacterium]|nr:Asp-tRNA(Asn)/Glu-tRNA(Gln) amidotransferase subunit GatB [Ignavibacteriales bacterium]
MTPYDKYEAVIGLEVHAQLSTRSKIFCGCSTEFGTAPNSNVCPICLGMPGVLPVLNKHVVDFAIRMGLATNCTIAHRSIFARKNYFYPDLPKGYQISQYEEPICQKGFLDIELENGSTKRIGITRIHMEEDAGKSIHDAGSETLVDVNRCGTPLLEIVSEPDIRSAREAYLYLYKIWQTVKYLGICDGNMEEGSLRCDANVSVRLKGETRFGTKAEVKNMNSFSNVERAIEFEIKRQIDLIEGGGKVIQQTLLWDAEKNVIVPMRSKEEAHDYRYFPDPDLVPVVVTKEWINDVQHSLPELPDAKRKRFVESLGLPKYDAEVLSQERELAEYFEGAVNNLTKKNPEQFKSISNWVMTDVLRVVNEEKISISDFPISPPNLAEMVNLIIDGTISGKIAKEVFDEMLKTKEHPKTIVERKGLVQISDTGAIEKEIDAILAKFPNEITRFRSGEAKLMGFFVGETMKVMKGKANPKVVNEILKKKLEG